MFIPSLVAQRGGWVHFGAGRPKWQVSSRPDEGGRSTMMLFVFMQSPLAAVGVFLSSMSTRGFRIKGHYP